MHPLEQPNENELMITAVLWIHAAFSKIMDGYMLYVAAN